LVRDGGRRRRGGREERKMKGEKLNEKRI